MCTGVELSARRERRAVVSLSRYVLRLRHRATPFGLLAGVAPATVGPTAAARWGEEHRPVARADSAWLTEVISALEKCPELLRRLSVVVEPTCIVRDDRLVVPCQQPPPQEAASAPRQVSVRHTAAVKTVIQASGSPISVQQLAGRLTSGDRCPAGGTVDRFIAELVARRILLTLLRPPMTVTDGLGHVNRRLAAAGAEQISEVAPTVRALREIETALYRHNTAPTSAPRHALRRRARERMRELSALVEQPVTVDLKLDCTVTLPPLVLREAEKAAAALTRLTGFPSGTPEWAEYHTRFLERYGPGAVVPVLRLTDPDAGIGLPGGYRGSRAQRHTPGLTTRDHRLLALAQKAALDGVREVALSDGLLDDLTLGDDVEPPAHLDLCFQLQASSLPALDRGDFVLVVVGMAPAAGASIGRFLDLLDPADRCRMTSAFEAVPTLVRGALPVQISCPPVHGRTENVGRAPLVHRTVVSLAEHHDGPAVRPQDLAVTADAHRFRLVIMATGQTVEPVALNVVESENFTHPLARFLRELPTARAAVPGAFPWGAARRLPFLPRIRYGKAVLAPATWRVEARDLRGPDSQTPWAECWAEEGRRLGVPRLVYLGDDDRRLRLDLEEPAHLELLRSEVERRGHATLREAPDRAAYGWFGGRPSEITVSLASTRSPAAPAAARPCQSLKPRTSVVIGREHGHLPGASPWGFVKLYGHPDRQNTILTGHLRALLSAWDGSPQWWFVRYADPDPHLRLRIKLPAAGSFAQAAERVGGWAADLRDRGLVTRLVWDTYYPETGRFGADTMMDAAEEVFAADSGAVVTQISSMTGGPPGGPDCVAVSAASVVDLAIAFTGDTATGMRWLIDHLHAPSAPPVHRPLHDQAMRLADPTGDFAALRRTEGGEAIVAAWQLRRTALTHYAKVLAASDGPGFDFVLASLVHLHLVRTAGIDDERERLCHRLARSAALAWRARTDRDGGSR